MLDIAAEGIATEESKAYMGNLLYRLLKVVLSPFIRIYFRLRTEGLENIPAKGGFILAANHASFLDVFIIGASVRQRPYFFIKDTYYRSKYLHWFFKIIECIEVRSEGANSRALIQGIRYLKESKVLHIFPEGTRSESGELNGFHKGVAFISIQSGAPVVPIYIDGTSDALSRHAWIPKPHPISCRIGRPIDPGGHAVHELMCQLEKSVESLKDL
jgi:1-acyl-sn-glycerol-3-phosphate acyltransferase